MEFKLILKKLNDTLSEEEATIFWEWYNESELHKAYFKKVQGNYHDDNLLIDIEKGWNAIEKKIKPKEVKKTNYLKYVAAASIVLLISITFLIKKENVNEVVDPVITNNTIKIGSDKATLTLEDGTAISLEKGKQYISDNLSSDGEALVYKEPSVATKEIIYNYLTIPRGGQYFVKLSDGTQVWLNSETQLKYPVSFREGASRQVELVYGEAYFDVSHSSEHNGADFKVLHNLQEIQVLGTEFNVKAYKDETSIATTLVKGKVVVSVENQRKVLKPREQFNLNTDTKKSSVSSVDVYSEIAWKNGLFSFKDKTLKDIMKTLSRWYDVEIVFEDKSLEDIHFKGVLNKNQDIEDILKLIQNINFIEAYDIENKTIFLKN
ncbi:FecR family protein [Algibacter miyuki]|uniref:FecR family protein n=1 Tax=Algibacter miyuki TaxID=1306933 RepID=A0ABV5H4M2_9FLAO|nr:FecR family protein [Algibacter miyuki]MDN3665787.1 FecR family protein [Algibacter miyuki]